MFKTRNIPIALIALGVVGITTMPFAFAASTITWVAVQVLIPTAIVGSIWAFGPTAVIYGFAIIGFYEWFHSPDSGGGGGGGGGHDGGHAKPHSPAKAHHPPAEHHAPAAGGKKGGDHH
jgi:uncharacterized membrane protein YgcG